MSQPSDKITPESVYFNRRTLLRAGIIAGSAVATGAVYRMFNTQKIRKPKTRPLEGVIAASQESTSGFWTAETKTPYETITSYNNYYEFSTNKGDVAGLAENFKTAGWKVKVDGLVGNPLELDIDDLIKLAPIEERVYRMRCVEAWSMVIPWNGYSLSKLLKKADPLGSAKFVAFTSATDKQMPALKWGPIDFPYVEGLRMDEAMHPLTLLASGIYGRTMPGQNGSPVRLVVPWKYGFKGAKALIKISLVENRPPTTWGLYSPHRYGFFSNVNPNPRLKPAGWSQASEDRIGEGSRDTQMFNGYGEQVASLYTGMDLTQEY